MKEIWNGGREHQEKQGRRTRKRKRKTKIGKREEKLKEGMKKEIGLMEHFEVYE